MNLPNRITLLRTILIPVFIFFLLFDMGDSTITILNGRPMKINIFIAAVIFIFASVTDFIDGYLARKYNLITNMGKFLDPLADKLLEIAIEFAVTGLRLLAVEKGEVIPAGILGKLKTISQLVAIVLILLGNPVFNIWHFELDYILLWISVILTILSGIEYFKNSIHVFK